MVLVIWIMPSFENLTEPKFDRCDIDDQFAIHSNNILIHQHVIKLADFGLSKRIEEATKKHSEVFGVLPYVNPKRFDRQRKNDNTLQSYTLNEKSDVYSVGVLLWEISSGRPPFYVKGLEYDVTLAIDIVQGLRESIIPVLGW
ncbi:15528_t:CDS:2 [Funneliformis geosporum]|nr:15528_t:CDS:2 [Funneliformis geosporum]